MAAILSAIGLLVLVFIVISDATNHSDNHKDISSFTFKAEVIEILDELSDQFNSNETTETELKSRQASSNPVGDLISGVLGVLTGNQRQPDKPPNKDDPPIESQNQRMFNCEPNERQVTTIKSDQGQFCCVSQESGQTNYCKSFRCVSKSASSGCCTVPGMKQRFCPGLMSGRCKKSERRYNYVDEKQGSARSCCVTSSHQQRFCSMQRCASFLNGCCQVQRTQNRFCPGYFATFTAILVGGIFGKPQTTGTNTGTGSNGGYGGNGFGTGAGQSDGDKTSTTTTSGPPTTSKGTTAKGKPRPKPVVTTEAATGSTAKPAKGKKRPKPVVTTEAATTEEQSTESTEDDSTEDNSTEDDSTTPEYEDNDSQQQQQQQQQTLICIQERQKVMEEFRKATEQFAEVSRKVKQEEATRVPPESELRANGTEDGGTSRLGSATSSIVNVLTRIPGTVVGALTSLTRTIGGLEAEF